jgi:hypothetical protein
MAGKLPLHELPRLPSCYTLAELQIDAVYPVDEAVKI